MNRLMTNGLIPAFLAGLFLAVFSGLASAGSPSQIPIIHCGDAFGGEVFHFDKIIFRPRDGLKISCPAFSVDPFDDAPTVFTDQDVIDIKVMDFPETVADVRRKAAEFLNGLVCQLPYGKGIPVHHSHLVIIDVEYATACGGPPPIE